MQEIINLERLRYYPLKEHECYFNWIDNKFSEVSAKERLQKNQCHKQCEKISECDFCSFDGDWRSTIESKLILDNDDDDNASCNLHHFVSWNGEMIFLESFLGEHEKAEERLNYLIGAIERDEHKEVEYLDGYKYIGDTLAAFIKLCKSLLHRSDIESLQNFDDLSQEAQIGVLSIKFVFYDEAKNTFNIQIELLRKLIELDPNNPVWHATLGLRLRLIKNQSFNNGHRLQVSSLEESLCFETAYNLRPDVPRFFAMFSRNIAEILKVKRVRDDETIDVNVLNQHIQTASDAVEFLRKYTRLLLEAVETIPSKDDIAKTLSTMGEVFSVSLPPRFHDLDLAEQCIATAIQRSPTCSKANHRMGLFQWSKRHNYEKSMEYLTEAVSHKSENYYAIIDWMELLLNKAEEKANALTEIFDELLSTNFSWRSDQMARLIFLKGCFLFMTKGKKKETMDCWINAYEMTLGFYFRITSKESKRFGWTKFENGDILRLLTSSKRRSRPVVKKMIYEVRNLMVKTTVEKKIE